MKVFLLVMISRIPEVKTLRMFQAVVAQNNSGECAVLTTKDNYVTNLGCRIFAFAFA